MLALFDVFQQRRDLGILGVYFNADLAEPRQHV